MFYREKGDFMLITFVLPGLYLVQIHLQGYESALSFGNGSNGVNQMYFPILIYPFGGLGQ